MVIQEIINLNDSKISPKNYLDDFLDDLLSEELRRMRGAAWGAGGRRVKDPIVSNPGTVSDLVTCIRLYVIRAGREGDGKPAP